MTIKHFIIGAGIAALASAGSAALAQQGPAGKGSKQAQTTRYCIQFENETGSRLRREECRTKKGWAQVGVDVDGLLKK